MSGARDLVFCGGDVHRHILSFLQPIDWLRACERVNKTWRRVCVSTQLWAAVLERVLREFPALCEFEPRGGLPGYRGKYWFAALCSSQDTPLTNIGLIDTPVVQQIARSHLHSLIRDTDTIKVEVISQNGFGWQILYKDSADHLMLEGLHIVGNRKARQFCRPLYNLVLRGSLDFGKCSMLWGSNLINTVLLRELRRAIKLKH